MNMEKEFMELKIEIGKFIAKTEERHINTDIFRDDLKKDIKDINEKLNQLPCEARKEKFRSIDKAFMRIWTILMLCLAGLIGLAGYIRNIK